MVNNLVGRTALNIPCNALALVLIENLTKQNGRHFPLMRGQVVVVEASRYFQSGIADWPEWQYGYVKIEQVGVIPIDDIKRPIVEVGNELLRRLSHTVAPTPLLMNHAIGPGAPTQGMILLIKVLRIQAFPPFALAVGLGEPAIVRHPHLVATTVVAARRLVPRPRMVGM